MKIIIKRSNNAFLFVRAGEILYKGILAQSGLRTLKRLYNKDNHLISEIRPRLLFPFKPAFEISHVKNQILTLEYTNIFKPKYVCNGINEVYDIIPHKGYYTSIFNNNKQIGYFEEGVVTILGNESTILYLNNLNTEKLNIICSFALAIKCNFFDDSSIGSINLGNWGFEFKKFDSKWHPNDLP